MRAAPVSHSCGGGLRHASGACLAWHTSRALTFVDDSMVVCRMRAGSAPCVAGTFAAAAVTLLPEYCLRKEFEPQCTCCGPVAHGRVAVRKSH